MESAGHVFAKCLASLVSGTESRGGRMQGRPSVQTRGRSKAMGILCGMQGSRASCPRTTSETQWYGAATLVWARECAGDVGLNTCLCCFPPEGDVYKAQTPHTETQGAPEVREDDDVQVEAPADQVGCGGRRTLPIAVRAASAPCLPSLPPMLASL